VFELHGSSRQAWQHRQQTPPAPDVADFGSEVEEDNVESAESVREEDGREERNRAERWIITPAKLPLGTALDNRELADANMPTMRAAVRQWEEALGTSFTWAAMEE
jgi:hypothetical protein